MPTYLITITVLAATEKDYKKLSQEMENKLFQITAKPNISGSFGETCRLTFKCSLRISLLEATAIVSQAALTIGKKFSFTIMKEKAKMEV